MIKKYINHIEEEEEKYNEEKYEKREKLEAEKRMRQVE